jgi:hypothetical protein
MLEVFFFLIFKINAALISKNKRETIVIFLLKKQTWMSGSNSKN